MKLIEGARCHWWRLWSVRLTLLGLLTQGLAMLPSELLLGIWNMMPGEVRSLVPQRLAMWIAIVLFAATAIARVIPQKKLTNG